VATALAFEAVRERILKSEKFHEVLANLSLATSAQHRRPVGIESEEELNSDDYTPPSFTGELSYALALFYMAGRLEAREGLMYL
jgi:hypothetical protein